MEWLREFLSNNLIGLITAVSAIVALIVERRKRVAEQKQSEADALQGMQTVYDKFVADTDRKIEELLDDVKRLQLSLTESDKKIKTLEEALNSANTKLREFEVQAVRDKEEIAGLRRKIEQYEIELKSYKRSLK